MADNHLELTRKIQKAAIPMGLIYGGISLVMMIFGYYFITSMTTSIMWIFGGSLIFYLLIPLTISIFLIIDLRKKIGGYWSFRQAVTGIFIMFIISSVIGFLGHNLLFAKVIEPNMAEKMETTYEDATSRMLDKQGLDQASIDAKVKEMHDKYEETKGLTVGGVFKSLGMSIIFTFVFSLIFGAIFKRDPPLYETPFEEK